MLPINTPSAEMLKALLAEGINEADLLAAVKLDLDRNGSFGEAYLALDMTGRRICSYDAATDTLDLYPMDTFKDQYIDNFTSTNRILVMSYPAPFEDRREGEDDCSFNERSAEYRKSGTTRVLGYCTNACKRRLFTFITVWERFQRGDVVSDNDAIFLQFNAKCPKCGTVYPNQDVRICEHCSKRKGMILRLLAYFKPFKLQLFTVLVCMFLTSALSLLSPVISGQILFDQVISLPTFSETGEQITGKLHELKYVFILVGVMIGMALLQLFVGIMQNRANAHMSTRVTKTMKNDIFGAMCGLSISYFNQNPTGRLVNRVNYDAVKIRNFYIDGVPHLIVNALNFIGLTVFLFMINWKLTLIVFIPVPIIVIIFKTMLPKLWRSYSKQYRRSSSLNAMLNDTLTGVRVVKAFAKEAEETNRFYQYSSRLYSANLRTNIITLSIFPVVGLLIGLSSTAIWGFGGIEVMGGTMTYGQLTTYLSYIGMIFGPLNFFTTFTNLLTDTINSAERMFEVIDQIPEISDSKDAKHLDDIRGEIVFNNVCFHYSPNRPILKDVSFTIHAGDHVGLVGHTGSGKSTIANLITRMYDVISGTITIDGIDLKDIEIQSLRRNIAIVSQEIFIFRATIADNIRYARPNATMAEVIEAAKAANAHDFIMALPEGYNTMVGIGSRSLSGGERQRISIARALLLKPSLLILDEATAAMDTETERLISEAIDKLVKGKTTISIAHRLATLKNCNYLMAIENGSIAEMGTEQELMDKKGVYYKLWTLQTQQMQKVLKGE
ncbi:MAG: ABC transporter ATP-binding protein [Clostridia bacterium]|nr:ABC transporter ATP-binding protein [Clostridia bacterium]